MKKSLSLLATAIVGAWSLTASAQSVDDYTILQDVTAEFIQNADFSADNAVSTKICTYCYDMADDSHQLYGQQNVTNWNNVYPSDNEKRSKADCDAGLSPNNGRAAGIFGYRASSYIQTDARLAGDSYMPPLAEEALSTRGGRALGMVAVWECAVQYTQPITLPAGAYMMVMPVVNTAGTSAVRKNLMGFITEDGTEHLCTTKSYAVGNRNEVVAFKLKEETSGVVTVGYVATSNGSGAMPHLFIDGVQLYTIDSTPLDQPEIKAGKKELQALIERGTWLGADTEEAEAVCADENVTLARVLAAIEQQKAYNEATKTDVTEAFITNPHFDLDEAIDDGICTYERDMEANEVTHYGMQPLTGWKASDPEEDNRACGVFAIGDTTFVGGKGYLPPTEASDGTTEGRLLGFTCVWSVGAQYTQDVTLPAGKYIVTLSYYNAGGTQNVAKNLTGFVADNGTEHLCTTRKFGEKTWEQMELLFELEEGTPGHISIGYAATNNGSGAMPHLFIDGIKLQYVGQLPFDASLLPLQGSLATVQPLLDEPMYTVLKGRLQEAVNEGDRLVKILSSDKEANVAATDSLNALRVEAMANVEAYKQLAAFRIDPVQPACGKFADMAPVAESLDSLAQEIDTALEAYSWDTEKINDVMDTFDDFVKGRIQDMWNEAMENGTELDHPINITPLLGKLEYTFSNSPAEGDKVPDKEWDYGTATNFKTHYGTAEVWGQSPFAVARTLSGLPAGSYTVTTHAFYRTAKQQDNYDSYMEGNTEPRAFVFANHVKTGVANVAELASEDEERYANKSTLADGKFVPNSQADALSAFTSADSEATTRTSATTALPSTGALRLGVCADTLESNSWVVWHSFEVFYNVLTPAAAAAELGGLIDDAHAAVERAALATQGVHVDQDGLDSTLVALQCACDSLTAECRPDSAIVMLQWADAVIARADTLAALADSSIVMRGDLNLNREITVTDYNILVKMVLHRPTADDFDQADAQHVAADVNGNRLVDIADVSGIINILLEVEDDSQPDKAPAMERDASLMLAFTDGGEGVRRLAISLDAATGLTAAQLDLVLPQGMHVADCSRGEGASRHKLYTYDLGDGRFRILMASLRQDTFSSQDAILYVDIEGDAEGSIAVENAIASDAHAAAIRLNVEGGEADAIGTIRHDGTAAVYNTIGQPASAAAKGISIVVGADGKAKKVLKK